MVIDFIRHDNSDYTDNDYLQNNAEKLKNKGQIIYYQCLLWIGKCRVGTFDVFVNLFYKKFKNEEGNLPY